MFNVLITKPRHQASTLLAALAEIPCLSAQNLATIDIVEPTDTSSMQRIASQLESIDWAIFNSVNAVSSAASLWPKGVYPKQIAAIGPTTANALREQGCQVDLTASPPSSEGLLANPAMSGQQITNKHIAIFCGENPKRLLFKQLQQRGASVTPVYCYRRQCANPTADEISHITNQTVQCIICSSTESLINLFRILAPNHLQWLLSKQLIVINPTMQTLAVQLGCLKSRVHVADNATNPAILNAVHDLLTTQA